MTSYSMVYDCDVGQLTGSVSCGLYIHQTDNSPRFIKHAPTFALYATINVFIHCAKYSLHMYISSSPKYVIQLQKYTQDNILIISHFLQITDRYENYKYIVLKPSLSFGMSWLFF